MSIEEIEIALGGTWLNKESSIKWLFKRNKDGDGWSLLIIHEPVIKERRYKVIFEVPTNTRFIQTEKDGNYTVIGDITNLLRLKDQNDNLLHFERI